MDEFIYNEFSFLVELYSLKYKFQSFDLGGGWVVSAHSFFNNTGCFTIYSLDSRGELDFYYSRNFSSNQDVLFDAVVDVYSIEKSIWNKHGKLGFFPNPFFWWSNKKIVKVVAEVVAVQIQKNNEFFGIQICECV